MEHNPELGINNEGEFERMYLCVKNMADIVVPQASDNFEIISLNILNYSIVLGIWNKRRKQDIHCSKSVHSFARETEE